MTKTITPLIPEKNTLPDSDLNKSNGGKLGDNPTQNTENKEIKLNLTNRFDEAEGEFKLITNETEKIDARDINDSCTVRKETKAGISPLTENKNFCDPIMFQSSSTPKEMFSLREGVDFTFKKSINTENRSDLHLSSNNNKLSPNNEISEYINDKDSFKLSVIENDNNNKSPINYSKTVKNPFNNFNNKNSDINKLELSNLSNKEENHNKTEVEIKLKDADEVNTYIKSQFNLNLTNCGENANTRKTGERTISIKENQSINLSKDELSLYTKIKNINSITNKKINYKNIDIDADELTLKNSFVSNNNMPFTSQIYSNLIRHNQKIKKDDELSISKNNNVKIDDISSNFNKSIVNHNNISNTSCNFTNNINNISLSNSKVLQQLNDCNSKNKEETLIDIASFDNKSINPSSEYSSLKYASKNENETDVLNITDDNIEAEEDLNEREPSSNRSDSQSVISSKIMTHINTPKMMSYVKTSTEQSFALSNFTKSDMFNRFDKYQVSSSCNNSKLYQENEDFEYEIMHENLDGYNNFIDTPKSSNLYLPILKNNAGSNDKNDPLHKHIASSYNFNHPQLKELNERLSRKEKEMKKINEKIQQVMSDLLKYEEENKKQERKIEKEEAEAQMLRNFLNFLTTQG